MFEVFSENHFQKKVINLVEKIWIFIQKSIKIDMMYLMAFLSQSIGYILVKTPVVQAYKCDFHFKNNNVSFANIIEYLLRFNLLLKYMEL